MSSKKQDCGFTVSEGWFRYRACAIIIKDGKVLMAKNEREPYYYSVGGGVHLHESAEDAVLREVFEETGVQYEIERLAFIHENFFMGYMTNENQRCHEIALYFLMKPNANKEFRHIGYTFDGVKEQVVWLSISKLHEYTIYPTFFKEKLLSLDKSIEHIVTHE